MDRKIRVLQVVSGMNRGGVEMLLMNILRHADARSYEFYFYCHLSGPFEFEDEIRMLGGHIVQAPKPSSLLQYLLQFGRTVRAHDIKVVHTHTYLSSGIPLLAAWLWRVPIRIAHSHSSRGEGTSSLQRRIYSVLMRTFIRYLSTTRVAVGTSSAGMFGQRHYDVIHNGISLDAYRFRVDDRDRVRRELNIPPDSSVLLHVGRFQRVKNHRFLLSVFEEYCKTDAETTLILAGDGPERGEIETIVAEKGLLNRVRFLGSVDDTAPLYSAADLFLLPSYTEGFSVALVEAQANGLPALVSTAVPREGDLSGNVTFLDLAESTIAWAAAAARVAKSRKLDAHSELAAGPADVRQTVQRVLDLYHKDHFS